MLFALISLNPNRVITVCASSPSSILRMAAKDVATAATNARSDGGICSASRHASGLGIAMDGDMSLLFSRSSVRNHQSLFQLGRLAELPGFAET
jgi:hypothetical protein